MLLWNESLPEIYVYSGIVAHNDDAEAEWHVNEEGSVLSRFIKNKTIKL